MISVSRRRHGGHAAVNERAPDGPCTAYAREISPEGGQQSAVYAYLVHTK